MYGGGLPFKNRIRNACLSALRTIICARWTFSGQQYLFFHVSHAEGALILIIAVSLPKGLMDDKNP